jgi:hypothetical protein
MKKQKAEVITSSYEPSKEERLALGQTLQTPGWPVVQKIAIAACEEFKDTIFKLNPQETKDYDAQVLKLVMRAEVAVTVWEGIARRIEKQEAFLKAPKERGQKPTLADAVEDVTEGL